MQSNIRPRHIIILLLTSMVPPRWEHAPQKKNKNSNVSNGPGITLNASPESNRHLRIPAGKLAAPLVSSKPPVRPLSDHAAAGHDHVSAGHQSVFFLPLGISLRPPGQQVSRSVLPRPCCRRPSAIAMPTSILCFLMALAAGILLVNNKNEPDAKLHPSPFRGSAIS